MWLGLSCSQCGALSNKLGPSHHSTAPQEHWTAKMSTLPPDTALILGASFVYN